MLRLISVSSSLHYGSLEDGLFKLHEAANSLLLLFAEKLCKHFRRLSNEVYIFDSIILT